MKTAISIPDALFNAAERLAKRLHVSRSRLFADAVSQYVEKYEKSDVTERLNQVYSVEPSVSKVPFALAEMQTRSLDRDEW